MTNPRRRMIGTVISTAMTKTVVVRVDRTVRHPLYGKVISIDPVEKLIEGVVYYETTISFDDILAGLKPGMTADLTIHAASKENVLTIPKGAIQEKDGKITVEVLNGKSTQQKEIKIGLKGSNDLIEVVSGLEEGEEIIVK